MSKAKHEDADGQNFDTERMTQERCADILDITPRTLRQWEKDARAAETFVGPFPRNRDGTYPLKGMLCWLMARHLMERLQGRRRGRNA